MRRRAVGRRERRLLQLARWFETFWWCECDYHNIAAYRCYHCGARPPRRLRAELAAMTTPTREMASSDA